jgi:hypothetical protein
MNQLRGESNMEFEERKKFYDFLSSKKIKDNDKISKIYTNIKFRECRYSPKMYHFIMKLEKEFKSKSD